MSKSRHRNVPGPGHFKVQGHRVEDNDAAATSKQALDREAARLQRRGPRKAAPAAKKARARIAPKVDVAVPAVLERAHDREVARVHERDFGRMNERRSTRAQQADKRVKSAGGDGHQPRYLAEAARGVIRRVARVALAPLSIARAVVDRIRDRD